MQAKQRVLVLGAGIQGISVALALRCRGYRVTVIDRMPGMMLRTSLRNEGKIHLGFVYANDPSFKTAELLLRAALCFAPLLEEWLECKLDWSRLTSIPFIYAVMRDLMLAPDALVAHYEQLQASLADLPDGETSNYLGTSLSGKRLWQAADESAYTWFSPARVAALFETRELALDRNALRTLLCERLAAFPELEMRFGHHIATIERTRDGFTVAGTRDDGARWTAAAPRVINCLWDGRLALDAQLRILPARAFVMRLKCRLVGALPAALAEMPSTTMVLGKYGDLVRYPHSPAYFSWYPTCLRGWSQSISPPPEWEQTCAGNPPPELAAAVTRETLDALEQIVLGIRASSIDLVDGGIIYAWGETDIDDPASVLHTRHEIGFTAHDGYYSVDTGKFTCAPMFAAQLVEHLDSTR